MKKARYTSPNAVAGFWQHAKPGILVAVSAALMVMCICGVPFLLDYNILNTFLLLLNILEFFPVISKRADNKFLYLFGSCCIGVLSITFNMNYCGIPLRFYSIL